jgi:hypothetical protein
MILALQTARRLGGLPLCPTLQQAYRVHPGILGTVMIIARKTALGLPLTRLAEFLIVVCLQSGISLGLVRRLEPLLLLLALHRTSRPECVELMEYGPAT